MEKENEKYKKSYEIIERKLKTVSIDFKSCEVYWKNEIDKERNSKDQALDDLK